MTRLFLLEYMARRTDTGDFAVGTPFSIRLLGNPGLPMLL